MDDFVSFGGRYYCRFLLLLFFGRGMDILSTWVATPNLVLEGNPLAKKLGWRWGIPLNFIICVGLAMWPLTAIAVSTTSALVAARNFQSAWIMRTMGEHQYCDWHVQRILETRSSFYLFCLFAQTSLVAAVGLAVVYFDSDRLVPSAIGVGIICYAGVVTFYTLLAVWRLRRAYDRQIAKSLHVFTDTR
jgi:hypothetical protein